MGHSVSHGERGPTGVGVGSLAGFSRRFEDRQRRCQIFPRGSERILDRSVAPHKFRHAFVTGTINSCAPARAATHGRARQGPHKHGLHALCLRTDSNSALEISPARTGRLNLERLHGGVFCSLVAAENARPNTRITLGPARKGGFFLRAFWAAAVSATRTTPDTISETPNHRFRTRAARLAQR
jgi:hypothetical protein